MNSGRSVPWVLHTLNVATLATLLCTLLVRCCRKHFCGLYLALRVRDYLLVSFLIAIETMHFFENHYSTRWKLSTLLIQIDLLLVWLLQGQDLSRWPNLVLGVLYLSVISCLTYVFLVCAVLSDHVSALFYCICALNFAFGILSFVYNVLLELRELLAKYKLPCVHVSAHMPHGHPALGGTKVSEASVTNSRPAPSNILKDVRPASPPAHALHLEVPDTREASETPNTPNTPKTPKTPQTPQTPKTPKTPEPAGAERMQSGTSASTDDELESKGTEPDAVKDKIIEKTRTNAPHGHADNSNMDTRTESVLAAAEQQEFENLEEPARKIKDGVVEVLREFCLLLVVVLSVLLFRFNYASSSSATSATSARNNTIVETCYESVVLIFCINLILMRGRRHKPNLGNLEESNLNGGLEKGESTMYKTDRRDHNYETPESPSWMAVQIVNQVMPVPVNEKNNNSLPTLEEHAPSSDPLPALPALSEPKTLKPAIDLANKYMHVLGDNSNEETIKREFKEIVTQSNRSAWISVNATFIGQSRVSKTALINMLWEYRDDSQAPGIGPRKPSERLASWNTSIGDTLNDHEFERVRDLDNSMMETYRQFYFDLDQCHVRGKFRDTVGDVRFFKLNFWSMLQSNVTVLVYRLSFDDEGNFTDKTTNSIKYITQLDKMIDKFCKQVKSKDTYIRNNVESGLVKLKSKKFKCVLIGIFNRQIKDESTLTKIQKELGNRCTWDYLDPINHCCVYNPRLDRLYTDTLKTILMIMTTVANNKNHRLDADEMASRQWLRRELETSSMSEFIVRKDRAKTAKSEDIDSPLSNLSDVEHDFHSSCSQVEVDTEFPGLLASVNRRSIRRKPQTILQRFVRFFFAGIFFPFLLTLQTCVFLMYSAAFGVRYINFPPSVTNKFKIDNFDVILYDFLSPIFIFARPTLDPHIDRAVNAGIRGLISVQFPHYMIQKVIDEKLDTSDTSSARTEYQEKNSVGLSIEWFMRQTAWQNVCRIIFSAICLAWTTMAVLNVSYYEAYGSDKTNQVSKMETEGPFWWYLIIWCMLASWYCHSIEIMPNIDNAFNEKYRKSLTFEFKDTTNDNEKVRSNVDIFLKSYRFYHTFKNQSTSAKTKHFGVSAMYLVASMIYALIPGITRIFQGEMFFADNKNHPDAKRTVFFGIALNWLVVFCAFQVFDQLFLRYFLEYTTLMTDITSIIEIPGTEETSDAKRRRGFEFLSLDSHENLVSWMELRSYAYEKGKQLFSELEIFMTFVFSCIIWQACFVFLKLISDSQQTKSEQTVIGVSFMLIASIFSLMRVLFLGFKFDRLQKRQRKALNSQVIVMRNQCMTLQDNHPSWKALKVGTWNQLLLLKQRRAKKSMKKGDTQALKVEQTKFDEYMRLMEAFEDKIGLQSINPKIFSISLTGALIKTIVASIFSVIVALIKLLIF